MALGVGALVLGGCGGGDDGGGTTSTVDAEPTVEIAGETFTCDELLERNCDDPVLEAFDRWGAGIHEYVNSGRLGPFNSDEYSYGEVAYNGLAACRVHDIGGDDQDFIDIMRDHYGPDFPGTALLPLWFEAIQQLCP
jgi:hypothetical protein